MRNYCFSHFVMMTVIATAILMVSCVRDEVVSSSYDPMRSETICFGDASDWGDMESVTRSGATANRLGKHDLTSADGDFTLPMGVYVENGIHSINTPETRGSVVNSKDDISNFNVWATLTKSDNSTMNYFKDVAYQKKNDNVFYPVNQDEEYYWPGSGKLDFTAIANTPESGFTATMTGDALTSFSYTVPSDATQQPDIMVATADDIAGDRNTSVPLNFKHIMSAVNIQIGKVVKGEIRSITLTGVYNKGTYNIATRKWSVDTSSKSDYQVKFADGDTFTSTGNEAAGTSVNASDATFMFIPQEPGEGAEMVIEFYDKTTGRLYSDAAGAYKPALRGSIAGDIWDMAKTTNYILSIDQSFTLTIEPTGKKLDAHYIISEVNITVDGIANWQITAKANDNAAVTILPFEEANPLAKQGFWTDKEVDASGNETTKSARGSSSYPGSGNITAKKFLLFIPENISDKDREISIILSSTDNDKPAETTKVLLQKNPNWTGGIGWEVVDDDEAGTYGFIWDRKVAYVLKYSWNRETGIGGNYNKTEGMNYMKSLITTYNASNYSNAVEFKYKNMWSDGFLSPADNQNRGYIYIDYSKLNNLSGASSPTEGLNNTKALFNIGGSAASMVFETVVSTTLKTKGDTSDPTAFHKVSKTDEYHTKYSVPAEEGTLNDLSGILTYILKKNRYCLQFIDDGQTQTYHAVFNENDLKWFLPAYNQFPDPTVVDFTPENSTDKAADYWSSTAADGSENAYQGGSSTPISRNTKLAVIAARVNENGYSPTATTVDNNSLTGGENGSTNNWVE